MTCPEIEHAARDDAAALWALGVIERHGPHRRSARLDDARRVTPLGCFGDPAEAELGTKLLEFEGHAVAGAVSAALAATKRKTP